ncbi:MAG TPA: hypothetical protein EYO33_02820 [Phycisphaerales bacterium]|nr:hypothetical protein [Phycisphaerales bacterium]
MRTKLRFSTRIDFSPSSTDVIQQAFRANGMYDPNSTGVGHQPRGFDEFMKVYKTFTVLGSSISVTYMYEGYNGPTQTSGAANLTQNIGAVADTPALPPAVCGLPKGVDALTAGAAEKQMEKDRTKWTFLTGVSGVSTLRDTLKVSDFYGKQKLVGSDGYTGAANADPAEQILWQVWVGRGSNDYPDDTSKITTYVTIEYDAVFTEPVQLTAS